MSEISKMIVEGNGDFTPEHIIHPSDKCGLIWREAHHWGFG